MKNTEKFESAIREEKMGKASLIAFAESIYDELKSSCEEKNIKGTGRIYCVYEAEEIKNFLFDYYLIEQGWNMANGEDSRADYKTLGLGSDSCGEYIRLAVFGCLDVQNEIDDQEPEDITEWMLGK